MLGRTVLPALAALLLALTGQQAAGSNSNIVINGGSYQNIAVSIDRNVRVRDPSDFVDKLKAFIEAGSQGLNTATGGKASVQDYTFIIPRTWNSSKLSNVEPADENLRLETADILFNKGDKHPLPHVVQVGPCGAPGRRIDIPTRFLDTDIDDSNYGPPGMIFAHEWSHFRYGTYDEHGCSKDSEYPNYDASTYMPPACYEGQLSGQYLKSCSGSQSLCNPSDSSSDCFYCINSTLTATDVKASIGYLPALSEGKYCDESTHNHKAVTPHNKLCNGRSYMEIIQAHPDFTSMKPHSAASEVKMTLREEPLGRVLILLDTPPTDGSTVVDYKTLLDEIKNSMTKYASLQYGMASYRDNKGTIQFYNQVDFTPKNNKYDTLYNNLPTAEARTSVPDLEEVLTKVVDTIGDYAPGTLLVIPVTEALMTSSSLSEDLGNTLHKNLIKPLLLFPKEDMALYPAGKFLQRSGSRFVHGNHTNTAAVGEDAQVEIETFVDNNFQNDHSINKIETVKLDPFEEDHQISLLYQQNYANHILAVVTATTQITDIEVEYNNFYVPTKCGDKCHTQDDNIVFLQTLESNPAPGESLILFLTNNGAGATTVTVTWSEVTFPSTLQEMDVEVWSSEGRGPVVDMSASGQVTLYASVSSEGYQVLSTRIEVHADITATPADNSQCNIDNPIQLLDDGSGVDVRKDDSIYSVGLDCPQLLTPGSTVVVNSVTIVGINNLGVEERIKLRESELLQKAERDPKLGKKSHGSELFPKDPSEVECCCSYVENPDIGSAHALKGFDLYRWGTFDTITVDRNHQPTTTTTTMGPTTTSTTTSTPSTTDKPTTTTANVPTTTSKPTTTSTVSTTTVSSTTDDGEVVRFSRVFLVVVAAVAYFQL